MIITFAVNSRGDFRATKQEAVTPTRRTKAKQRLRQDQRRRTSSDSFFKRSLVGAVSEGTRGPGQRANYWFR
ncbi:hypothetical protein KFK09_002733 [Dendrobium nobile]|uniref:Uncharacterized protein n=1 Tax=Dendrobium nobile TaxID=94219 RepID=A0A8T3C5Q7_DENNO|nr:hypothetical protein KFK09_002733 [Dendrobium nobile]